ncbi:NPP1 family protein [Gluconobacter wancherniae]|uniref:NPP1 family protein n=1 Tax=Gluconobacter wancherniae TaxID=1307955 RepID=UPI0031FE9D3E
MRCKRPGWYFFRNSPAKDSDLDGHRHEWEHAAIWLKNGVPQFVSVTHHTKLISKLVDQVPHLDNQKNTFALKYIRGSIPKWALDQLNGTGSHYPDFARGERKNGELVATNKDPSPNGKLFGEKNFNYIDYDKVPRNFKEIIESRANCGRTVPRINDVQYFLDHKTDGWFTPPLVPIIKTQP